MPGIARHYRHLCVEGDLDEREIAGIRNRAGDRQRENKNAFPPDEREDFLHGSDRKCEFFAAEDGIVLVKDPRVEHNGNASVDDEVKNRSRRPTR